jgi:hypothetical protein
VRIASAREAGSGGGTGCLATGESTTASFAVDGRVAPSLAGSPFSFRATALPGHVEFVPRSGFPGCPGYRP